LGASTRTEIKKTGNPFKSLVYAQILAVIPTQNTIEVSFLDSAGSRKLQIQSPFGSINSFRRSIPEVGSYVLLGFRTTSVLNPSIIKYLSTDEYQTLITGGQVPPADVLISQFSKPVDNVGSTTIPHRLLQSGEHEDLSSGQASAFFSNRGRMEVRSGNLIVYLDRDDFEVVMASPEIHFEGLDADALAMTDVLRFGTVSRYLDGIRWKEYIKKDDQFAKEFYMELHWKGTPATLAKIQYGICTDENGEEVTETKTGENLRYRKELSTQTDDIYGEYVDVAGNKRMVLPTAATEGLFYELTGGNSSWTVDVGKDEIKTIGENKTTDVGKNHTFTIGDANDITVGGDETITIGGEQFMRVTGNVTHVCSGVYSIKASLLKLN